ncbi:hypothetical protein DPMN_110363 [Dreissena polymorpha]|uniref:Uncharacterized protein n=1 Tax=Dreissena polymorpha TaxID=45954 RepID=A0A9D4QMU9_DREPO|nr:hypothetical protein DPMN_110363 [Dreissena polymorpha]
MQDRQVRTDSLKYASQAGQDRQSEMQDRQVKTESLKYARQAGQERKSEIWNTGRSGQKV